MAAPAKVTTSAAQSVINQYERNQAALIRSYGAAGFRVGSTCKVMPTLVRWETNNILISGWAIRPCLPGVLILVRDLFS